MIALAVIPSVVFGLVVFYLERLRKADRETQWRTSTAMLARLQDTYREQINSQRERIDELTKRLARALGRADPVGEPPEPKPMAPRRPRARDLWGPMSAEHFRDREPAETV